MNKIKMNKYRVAYHDENGKLRYKVIVAQTNAGALIRFKRLTGIKAIYAKYMLTKREEKLITKVHTYNTDDWDGRGYATAQYDGARGG